MGMKAFTLFRTVALVALCANAYAQTPAAPSASAAAPVVVQTKPGAMVSRIAAAHRPQGASIEQTLLAILRANPSAFPVNNINLLRKGAALTIPPAADILAIPADEAKQHIQQQHLDYERNGKQLAVMAARASAENAQIASSAPSPVAPANGVTAAPAQSASAASAAASVAATPASASSTTASAMASAASQPASQPITNLPPTKEVLASEPASTSWTLWAALAGIIALLLGGWSWMRVQRLRREEEARLAALAAEPQVRPAAEALARAMPSGSVDTPAETETVAPPTEATKADSPATPTTSVSSGKRQVNIKQVAGATAIPTLSTLPQAQSSVATTPDLSALVPAATAPKGSADIPREPSFDFSSISLELGEPATQASPEALANKLALAQEFASIQDFSGARVLAQEVADYGTPEQQAQARDLLATLKD